MKNSLTELVFLLDRSGSMRGLEKDTIGGFNSMVQKQKQEAGTALISTVLFDHEREIHIQKPQLSGQDFRQRAFPRSGGAVDGDGKRTCTHHIFTPLSVFQC